VEYIPRFVPPDNYANNFGLEWTNHARTQYDDYSGSNVSEKRFFEETRWARDLNGQSILETGSGSGRFTAQAASTGALVVSADYSYAVDVNYTFNGKRNNVFIIQADINNLPVRDNYFDKLFCLGVLQHTPDPRGAFMSLPRYLKKDGEIVVDVYKVVEGIVGLFQTKYWVRPITRKLNPVFLYRIVNAYVRFMWPICRLIRKLPYGRQLNRVLLVADYGGIYDLSEEMLEEWAIFDTFDMLSPAYDSPQTLDTVDQWFNEARLKNIEVSYGYNGIEGRGKKS
jgi:SAM-dependent methyltransferase